MRNQVTVAGGGASGLMAAIQAARTGADVTLLEHMDRVGKKILSTGNGKCNFTNLFQDPSCYRCSQPDFPETVLAYFDVPRTLEFFKELGIYPKIRNGYVYPNSEQAASVLDGLRMEADRLGITIRTSCHVERIRLSKAGVFHLETSQGMLKAQKVILAAGSKAAPSTGSDGSGYDLAKALGHSVLTPLPALVQLRCREKEYKQLAGIRTEARLHLRIDGRECVSQDGELQLTDYGISGIPTFQISRFASMALAQGQKVSVVIDFLPGMSEKETRHYLKERQTHLGMRNGEDFLTGLINKKLALVLMKQAGFALKEPVKQAGQANWERLVSGLKAWETVVTAANPFTNAQVCCGGVDTREIHPDTMESKKVKGLYLVGEMVDVDGICGGYNLQWAWSSGAAAGIHAGRGSL
ncbi:MAG: NAD(P)/FAD-dependent oxidoreductase [Lachnospiraceae bacterium]